MDSKVLKETFDKQMQIIGLSIEDVIIEKFNLESNVIGKCVFLNVLFVEEILRMLYENTFESCIFVNCNFYKGDFQRNIFRKCIFRNCSFKKGWVNEYKIIGCNFFNCDFTWGGITKCSIDNTTFTKCVINENFIKSNNHLMKVVFKNNIDCEV